MATWSRTPSGSTGSAFAQDLGFLDVIIGLLDVALAILQVAKAFAFGLIDPLTAILNALINELITLLNDLRKIGVYMHGDWYLASWPFTDLSGGYDAYQRRMVARLQDRRDPDRPDFGPNSAVYAVFLYVDAPIGQVQNLVGFLQSILALLNIPNTVQGLPTPADVRVSYGFGGASAGLYSLLPVLPALEESPVASAPSVINLSWKVASPPSGLSQVLPPTHGFLITASVYPRGLLACWSAPARDNTGSESGTGQSRRQGYYLVPGNGSGDPLRITGGSDQVTLEPGLGWNTALDGSGEYIDGYRQAYLVRDPADTVPIPVELLRDSEGRHLLQRSYYVPPSAFNVLYLNRKFGFRIPVTDLPYGVDYETGDDNRVQIVEGSVRPPSSVFFQVHAVSENITAPDDFQYNLAPVYSREVVPKIAKGFQAADLGPPSGTVEALVPADSSAVYLETLRAALAVLFLSRSDIPFTGDLETDLVNAPTGLEGFARSFAVIEFQQGLGPYFNKRTSSSKFRASLLEKVDTLANQIFLASGPPNEDFAARVASVGASLLDWKWADSSDIGPSDIAYVPDTTILGALRDKDATRGLIRNRRGILDLHRTEMEPSLAPVYQSAELNGRGYRAAITASAFDNTLADQVPLLFGALSDTDSTPYTNATSNARFWVPRSLFDAEVYAATAQVLDLAGASASNVPGGWISFRLFPQGLSALDQSLSELINWAESFKGGVQGFVEALVEYIEFLEARIRELQELIRRLQSYIDFTFGFTVPQANVLLVPTTGTDGIVRELVTAANKPVSAPGTYSAGVVIVTGSLSPTLVDLLSGFLGG